MDTNRVTGKCSVIALVMRHIKTRPAAVRALKHAFSLRTCLRTYLHTYTVSTNVPFVMPINSLSPAKF